MRPWRIRPWAWWLALAAVGLLFAPGWWHWQRLQARTERLATEIAWLDAENRRLLGEMARLQRDPVYLERVARRKLGRTRKGEVLYKVAPPTAATATTP